VEASSITPEEFSVPETDDEQEIQRLLKDLTWWQRASGLPFEGTSEIRSTGESSAAIEEIKRKLDRLGARFHWSESGREWRMDDGEPGTS
jgi:hypothetical protein